MKLSKDDMHDAMKTVAFHGGVENILKVHSNWFRTSYFTEIKYPSALDCRCGSKLTEIKHVINPRRYALFICGPEPRVKTRRKRKIVLKKYRRIFRRNMLAAYLVSPLRNRSFYQCETCGNRMGFYQAIVTNIIKVEPMPPGASVFYDKS